MLFRQLLYLLVMKMEKVIFKIKTMQAKHFDGSYGPIEPYTGEGLQKRMAQPNVEHVEVFEATEENLKARQKLLEVNSIYQKLFRNE